MSAGRRFLRPNRRPIPIPIRFDHTPNNALNV
jgi:hypothetical protein